MEMVLEVAVLDESYTVNDPYFNGRSYVDWLESFTIDERIDPHRRLEYHNLIRVLWEIDFEAFVGNDYDRAAEGLELRTRYNDILARKAGRGRFVTPDVHEIFGECRVLEMLIALSMRMYDLMQDMGVYNSVSRWFWEIMECVSFDMLDDDSWNVDQNDEEFVRDICDRIMHGDGLRQGRRGGWFLQKDWEDVEIWYQMHAYLKQYVSGLR